MQKIMLPSETVHIWKAALDQNIQPQEYDYLSSDEQARANRFYFKIHRERFIAARVTLRKLLGQYLNITPKNIQFEYTKQGKPFVQDELNLQFNMSHSENIALYAFCLNYPVGIDVEYMNSDHLRDAEGLTKRFFTLEEYQALMALPKEKRSAAFFHMWTQKEAFVKAIGTGLQTLLDQFVVSAQVPAQLISTTPQSHLNNHLILNTIKIEKPYFACVAVDNKILNMNNFIF